MNNYQELAKTILHDVGGKNNVIDVTHCMTRLRFNLKDPSLVNDVSLQKNPSIISTTTAGGRFQVIIGNAVSEVHKELLKMLDSSAKIEGRDDSSKKSIVTRFTDTITKIITPTLGVLVSTGLLKGLLALLLATSLISETSGTYQILNALGDALFYFFPIVLGYTSAKTFGLDVFVGMILGATLIYPGMIDFFTGGEVLFSSFTNTAFAMEAYGSFLKIPVIFPATGYASTVIPIILINYFASKLEAQLKKIIPPIVGFAFVPFLTLLISAPLGFLVIGPVANVASNLIAWITVSLFEFSPILTAILVGLIYQPLVIFGLHWPLITLAIANFTNLGHDYLWPMMFTASFAQTAAVVAVGIRTRDEKKKGMAVPATISGMMCIIEPAIYGFTLPQKEIFLFSMIGATVGGVIITIFKAEMFTLAIGLLGFVGFINPNGDMRNLYVAVVATIITMIITFSLTYFLYPLLERKRDSNE